MKGPPGWMLSLAPAFFLATPLAAATVDSCIAESRTPIVLRTDSRAPPSPMKAFLIANLLPELRILDASGRPLWSAGATGRFTQLFPEMTAGFTSSVSALDLDGDGVHDRIYAGDLNGRLWRFDLYAGASPRLTGGVFADFGEDRIGRGFLAPPDVTLMAPAVGAPWLSIAIGTANTTPATVASTSSPLTHRFFVLRDHGPLERWTQKQHDRWKTLVMADLVLADDTLGEGEQIDARLAAGAGFYLNLGTNQVLAPALTLDGKTIFTVAHTTQSQLLPCGTGLQTRVAISVGAVSATDGSPAMDLDGSGLRDANDLNVSLDKLSSADASVTLAITDSGTENNINCSVDGQALPDCSLDTRLHRSFWRREDAD